MRHPVPARWARSLGSLALVLSLWLTGCAIGGSTGSSDTSTSPTATSGPSGNTATPTSAPQQQASVCQNLSGFGGAHTATAGSGFNDVSFPSNSISTSISPSGGGAGRFTIEQFDVCTPATTHSAVYSFFSGGLTGAGWAGATTYPYDGAWQASCGDPYCWRKDKAPRYVSLEKVTDRGNGLVSYHMRLALPPVGPSCSSGIDIYAGKTWDANLGDVPGVQAPPQTLDGLGDGHDDGTASFTSIQSMCSAGSASSVNAFFTTELPKHGWHHSTPPSALSSGCHTTGAQWWNGKDLFSWRQETGGSPAANTDYWGYDWCHLLS